MNQSDIAQHLFTTFDLTGTFAFAVSGAISGIRHRVDLFGVLVLSILAATSGGILRDLSIGATPPSALEDWRYFAVSLLAGVFTFYNVSLLAKLRRPLLIFDAAGLGMFCAAGASKALALGLTPWAAVILGMLTGIGGGVVRDVVMSEVPTVFRGEIYATAALAGASFVVFGTRLGWPAVLTFFGGAFLCFALRCVAIWRRWNLPIATGNAPPGMGGGEPDASAGNR